jgi:outer membrane protein OmpA-like peptidoglycan-associated protein
MNSNKTVLAALLIVLLGGLCIGGYKWYLVWAESNGQVTASEAKVENTLRICGDGYLGYFFVDSPEMTLQSARRGLGVQFIKDNGDYGARLQKFATGQCDAIVLPINSYYQHGLQYKYPGVITGAIAESKGADAITCFADKVPSGKISDLNDASLQIVYGKESPSSFLIDLTMVDFDLFNLQRSNTWRQEVDGSEAALNRARSHQGDCFVMWEPDVSKAVRDVPGLKRIWGSESFSGYIMDVFVFKRDIVNNEADHVITFMDAYFATMRSYSNDRDRMISDMRIKTGLSQDEVEAMLKLIDWHDLYENASMDLGISTGVGAPTTEGLANSITRISQVLVKTNKITARDTLSDPYSIINTTAMKAALGKIGNQSAENRVEHKFTGLTDADWDKLDKIGMMKVEQIKFRNATSDLDQAGIDQIDKIAELLVNNYPEARVVVKGHTGPGSDEDANVALSRERAEAVVQRLTAVHGQQAERFHAVGVGSSEPPAKRPGQNPRDYRYNLPRVEFILYKDPKSF